MEKTLQKIPFLRLAIALSAGIVAGLYFSPPENLTLAFLISLPGLLLLFQKKYSFQLNSLFGIAVHLFFIFLGIYIFQKYNVKPVFFENGEFVATVTEVPQEKPNSFKSVIRVNLYGTADSCIETAENLIVYFEKERAFPTLKPGDVIVCNQQPQQIKNNGNPFEFDYRKYLARKKIYRQVYLPAKSWKKTGVTNATIRTVAENFREKLLSVYKRQPIGSRELEILSALTLGYKRDMDPEIKRVFSSAGAMHILAVSGLHVGIIFWMVSLLFGFFRKQKSGRFIFVLIAVATLWGYAIVTGLSPSVMRAAAMFSIFVIGENLQRKTQVYNSLAASAFFLLLFNPNNLFDIGFQLSYSAVFGIIYLQPKLEKQWSPKSKFVCYIWLLLTVSVAAQIATFPISAYYFNQFPSYFWLTNSIVIPSVIVLIPAGIGLLIFSSVPVLSTVIAFILNLFIKIIYAFLYFIDQLPYSAIRFALTTEQFIILLALVLLLFLYLETKKLFYLKFTLSMALLLALTTLYHQLKQFQSNTLIVYHSTENAAIHLIHGKTNYLISDSTILEQDYTAQIISNTCLKAGLNTPFFLLKSDTFVGENIFLKNGFCYFEGKRIQLGNPNPLLIKNQAFDYLIQPTEIVETNREKLKNTTLITSKKNMKKIGKMNGKIHFTDLDGAFRENW